MFFCYILSSLHKRYLNTTYIGFTDDPLHRIRQHNGEIKGGAKFTKRRRPWKIILVVSNFPNKIAALKFEWAWQNPFCSNFIKEDLENNLTIPKMNKKKLINYYNSIKFKVEVLNILINSKVFGRINLNINIFDNTPSEDLIITDILKSNMTKIININYDEFKNIMNKNKNKNENEILSENNLNENLDQELFSFDNLNIPDRCIICEEFFNNNDNKNNDTNENISENSEDSNLNNDDNEKNDKNDKKEYIVKCQICKSPFHMICLANNEHEKNNDIYNLVPKKADCFVCGKSLIWSEWVKNLTDQFKK